MPLGSRGAGGRRRGGIAIAIRPAILGPVVVRAPAQAGPALLSVPVVVAVAGIVLPQLEDELPGVVGYDGLVVLQDDSFELKGPFALLFQISSLWEKGEREGDVFISFH